METETVLISEALSSTTVRVERVPVARPITTLLKIRREGERIIIPVTEEVLVKRIRIIEEVHLITERSTKVLEDGVALRCRTLTIERVAPEQSKDTQASPRTDPVSSPQA